MLSVLLSGDAMACDVIDAVMCYVRTEILHDFRLLSIRLVFVHTRNACSTSNSLAWRSVVLSRLPAGVRSDLHVVMHKSDHNQFDIHG